MRMVYVLLILVACGVFSCTGLIIGKGNGFWHPDRSDKEAHQDYDYCSMSVCGYHDLGLQWRCISRCMLERGWRWKN